MAVCGACASENRAGARYCAGCGATLEVSCAACGTVAARPAARFCDECGSPLPGTARAGAMPAEQSRKVVTIVFVDLVGSTSAQEGADPEAVRRWVDRYNVVLRREVEAHGDRKSVV